MDSTRWERVQQLFEEASRLDGRERARFLENKCGSDLELYEEVRSLLEMDSAHAESVVDRVVHGAIAESDPKPESKAEVDLTGERIGPYTLLEKIGEGGFGTVHTANQRHPIERTVAIKILKVGMDDREIVARFEAERQALALMDHPSIAKVFDAGTTSKGRPYFVMELVDGVQLTEFCDQKSLGMVERLQLFVRICNAVQHAHQKGVIHRDLKPSNILITYRDGEALPVIIDFGIAKAIDRPLSTKVVQTQQMQLIGTPEYMSPEQTDPAKFGVDTRSDIYSLGVVLYQLLTGSTPLESSRLRRAGLMEIQRVIREVEPEPPSSRLEKLGSSVAEVARRRASEPGTLNRQVRGELDWIVMKAIDKDRGRRYDSVSHLAGDIQRHLANEPVLAGPPSPRYRLQKFVRRHRIGVTIAALVVGLLILGAVGTTVGLVRARKAEQLARAEAKTAERVINLLVNMYEVADPVDGSGESVSASSLIDSGVKQVRHELRDEPPLQAKLFEKLSEVYLGLGLSERAYPLAEESLRLRESRHGGGDHVEIVESLLALAKVDSQRGEHRLAEERSRQAVEMALRLDADSGLAVHAKRLHGANLRATGKLQEAQEWLEMVIQESSNHAQVSEADRARGFMAIGEVYRDLNDLELAETFFTQALEYFQTSQGELHPRTIMAHEALADISRLGGQYDEAQRQFEWVLEAKVAALGADHPQLGFLYNDLGLTHLEKGEYELAEQRYSQAIELWTRTMGEGHVWVTSARANMAHLYVSTQRYQQAATLFEKVIADEVRQLGADHPDLAYSYNNLGMAYLALEDYARAESMIRKSLDIRERVLPVDHPATATARINLSQVLIKSKRYEEAEAGFLTAISAMRNQLEPKDPDLADPLVALGRLYLMTSRFEDAEPVLREGMEIRSAGLPAEHWMVAQSQMLLGQTLAQLARYEESERLLKASLDTLRATIGPQSGPVRTVLREMVTLYQRWGKRELEATYRSQLDGS